MLDLLQQDSESARAAFDGVLTEQPGEPGAMVGLGQLAVTAKDDARAEALLGPIAAVTAPSGEGDPLALAYERSVWRLAWMGLAWSRANQARHEAAIEAYDQPLELNPDDPLALLGKGNSLSGLQRLDEAKALFQRVLEGNPGNAYAMAELALIHYNRGEDAQAEQLFQQALEVDDSSYTCPHEGLGLIYLRRGETEQAKASFERAIRIGPDIEYKKYNGLARIMLDEGRRDEAVRLLRKSVANYPYDPEARELLAELGEPMEAPAP